MKKKWSIFKTNAKQIESISKELKCNKITATILVNRGLSSPELAKNFLYPSFNTIANPSELKDAIKAAHRIKDAILENEKILIFGDYDADGITSTTLMVNFLKYTEADVSYYIPNRTDGYGLHSHHIKNIAMPNNIDLIITVDCGSSSINAVKLAKTEDIDVIITDHHQLGETLPDAVAIINPKRDDCTANLNNLAGVGVAFYLLICLRTVLREINFWKTLPEPNLKNYCDLVAIGTIADIVPLTNENRIFVKTGLAIMPRGCRHGIKALQQICKIGTNYTTSDDIAFKIAPRLNAAGRLEHADLSVNLLQSSSLLEATKSAHKLNLLNSQRQQIEKEITNEIFKEIKSNLNFHKNSSVILASETWHFGVLGIVASRITLKYNKPTILIAIKDGIGRGSARSVPDFDLYNGLLKCETLLETFGGHPMAAGLTIRVENIKFLKNSFDNIVQTAMKGKEIVQKISIDYKLDFDDISNDLVNELEWLQPFGCENTEPVFMTEDVHVISSSIIGGNHRKLTLKQGFSKSGRQLNAIVFNIDTTLPQPNYFNKIAYKLQWNRWRGEKNIQLLIEELGMV